MDTIISDYIKKTPKSKMLFERAKGYLINGVSHDIRFYEPYPLFIKKAKGSKLIDEDGNEYIDFWMGHASLILGHSPSVVIEEIRELIKEGTLFGTANEYSVELASLINKCVPNAEKVRFCSSGSEATSYAIRLARAYTGKKHVMKASGGWHGFASALIKKSWSKDSAGILEEETKHISTFRFNDLISFEEKFKEIKHDLACVIVEPVLGAGGAIAVDKDFLRIIREETSKAGALLIFDEVLTGFRLSLGGAQEYYKINADLITLGKIIGGGFPVGAIAGVSEVMELTDLKREKSARIGGGTFSENPVSMKAGILTVRYLMENKHVYDKINSLGEIARRSIDKIFSEAEFQTQTTGLGSIFLTHFLSDTVSFVKSAEDAMNCDKATQYYYHLFLMTYHDIFFLPTHLGAISYAHTDSEIQKLISATLDFSLRFKPSR